MRARRQRRRRRHRGRRDRLPQKRNRLGHRAVELVAKVSDGGRVDSQLGEGVASLSDWARAVGLKPQGVWQQSVSATWTGVGGRWLRPASARAGGGGARHPQRSSSSRRATCYETVPPAPPHGGAAPVIPGAAHGNLMAGRFARRPAPR